MFEGTTYSTNISTVEGMNSVIEIQKPNVKTRKEPIVATDRLPCFFDLETTGLCK